jgi:hypothetical protein
MIRCSGSIRCNSVRIFSPTRTEINNGYVRQ